MKRLFCVALGALAVVLLAGASQQEKTEDKAKTSRTLKVKLNYTGTGTVDEKHPIFVFLFDSPDFMQGAVMPFAMKPATAKDDTVTLSDVTTSPVYVTTVYDPTGAYDGQSGPPPSGSSLGMYSKTPSTPEPVTLEAGKTVKIELPFDDSVKMP
jgi:hypothetical protein